MSHFVKCQTEFRDSQALLAALIECGFEAAHIEVHQEAVPLYGYQGDARPQQARGRRVSRERLPSGEWEVVVEGCR